MLGPSLGQTVAVHDFCERWNNFSVPWNRPLETYSVLGVRYGRLRSPCYKTVTAVGPLRERPTQKYKEGAFLGDLGAGGVKLSVAHLKAALVMRAAFLFKPADVYIT